MHGRSKIIIIVGIMLIIGLAGIFLTHSEVEHMKGMLIFTQVSAEMSEINYQAGGEWPYPSQSRIMALNPQKPAETLKVLTDEFFSARSPEISYDGERLLFAGQHNKGEPWQIWEMGLDNLHARQVTSCLEGCTDPVYLPDGRIVFSSLETDSTVGENHPLYTCALDGYDVKRITFHPHSNFAPTVLQDGRVLTISRQLYPSYGAAMLMVLRPDGTKAELFYKNRKNEWPSSRGWETNDEKIVFIESNNNYSSGGRVVTISQRRPLHSRNVLTSDIEGSFQSVFPLSSGKLIVSYRKPGESHFALFEFDPLKKRLGHLIYGDTNNHNLEPVMVAKRPIPKKLPSIVNEQKTTGWFLGLNTDISDMQPAGNLPFTTKSKKVQVLGIHEKMGEVLLKEDGSFYIEITADTPVRFRTISENGQVVRGLSAWMWVRPNERRSCIGCHEDRELAPENKVPQAINEPPVSLLAPSSQNYAEGDH